jgi:hypothetical protein
LDLASGDNGKEPKIVGAPEILWGNAIAVVEVAVERDRRIGVANQVQQGLELALLEIDSAPPLVAGQLREVDYSTHCGIPFFPLPIAGEFRFEERIPNRFTAR